MHSTLYSRPSRPLKLTVLLITLFPLLLLARDPASQGARPASEPLSPLTGHPFRMDHDSPASLVHGFETDQRLGETSLDLELKKQFEETSFYLKDTDFISHTVGWAVGQPHWDQAAKAYAGTIIRTSNGGESWVTQALPVAETLNSVDFVDAQAGWAVGAKGTILHTGDGGAHWTAQTIATSDELRSVVFADAGHGWATSLRPIHYDYWGDPDNWQMGIWHTGDGGLTWVAQTLPIGASILQDVDFIDTQTGWAVGVKYIGDDPYGHPDHRPVVYKTSNGGQTWSEQYSPDLLISLTAVDFIDATHGWTVGFPTISTVEGGAVFHTTDGGQTWDRQEPGGIFAPLWDVKFIDRNRGYTVGFDYASAWGPPVWRTLDGGNTWEEVIMERHENDGLFGLFLDANRAVALGDHDYVVISTNPWGPYSWPHGEDLFTQSFINPHYRFEDVFFVDDDHGWAVGSRSFEPELTGQVILHTGDGGATWETQYEKAPDFSDLFSYLRLDSVYFANALNGWAVGVSADQHDAILHTSDGGQTWHEQGQELYAFWDLGFFDVKFLDLREGWVLATDNFPSQNIFLAHTTDGGAHWRWVDTGIEGPIAIGFGEVQGGLDFPDAQHGWAVGGLGKIVHTEDGGATWSAQTLNCEYCRIYGVDMMIDTQLGWIVGEGGLYRTSDGGVHWDALDIGYAGDLQDVQFLDGQNGWVAGWDGYTAYTADGGNTWTPVDNTATNETLRGLSFVYPDKGWLVGDYGTIMMLGHSTQNIRPQILANGTARMLTVAAGTPVEITVALDPGSHVGANADWWVGYQVNGSWLTYVYPMGWGPGMSPAYQGGLFALSTFAVLNQTLAAGDYDFYMAIDTTPDGDLTFDTLWYDYVRVVVE
jgi:photosystem II stability/assembly factor-like uncharacterized protein